MRTTQFNGQDAFIKFYESRDGNFYVYYSVDTGLPIHSVSEADFNAMQDESESVETEEEPDEPAQPQPFKMFINIEQGDYIHEASFTFRDTPNVAQVANVVLNEVYSFTSINRLLLSAKNRPSMAKPFTFALSFEQGGKESLLQDFSTKITAGEKAQQKLMTNMPAVIAELLVSKEIPFAERRAAVANPQALIINLD